MGCWGVGEDGRGADSLAVERYLDSYRLIRGLRPYRAGHYDAAWTIGGRGERYGNRKWAWLLIQDYLDGHGKSSCRWRVGPPEARRNNSMRVWGNRLTSGAGESPGSAATVQRDAIALHDRRTLPVSFYRSFQKHSPVVRRACVNT